MKILLNFVLNSIPLTNFNTKAVVIGVLASNNFIKKSERYQLALIYVINDTIYFKLIIMLESEVVNV